MLVEIFSIVGRNVCWSETRCNFVQRTGVETVVVTTHHFYFCRCDVEV